MRRKGAQMQKTRQARGGVRQGYQGSTKLLHAPRMGHLERIGIQLKICKLNISTEETQSELILRAIGVGAYQWRQTKTVMGSR